MPKDVISGAIDHVRLLVDAITEGRIEARTVKEMTDEQLGDYIARLRDEGRSAVEDGYAMHEATPEGE